MAYDEDLANRLRELLADEPNVTEQKMFGGLAFLIGGHMAVCASGQGGIMVRVDPAETAKLLTTTTATPMIMRDKELDGWVRVSTDEVRTARQLKPWVTRGAAYASSLPPKKAGARKA